MLNIGKTAEGAKACLSCAGRLDTTTAPQLEAELKSLAGVTELTLDFGALEYISSAGLRVLLGQHKVMIGRGGAMKIVHVNELVKEVFDVTGFSDILTIEA